MKSRKSKEELKQSSESSAEGNVYDRIFKENAESIFMPFIAKQLDIQISTYQPLPDKISKTVEREMDFLYRVKTKSNSIFLLHIEFQTSHDATMLYRMAEYHGLGLAKYKLPIRHVVIYLGASSRQIETRLPTDKVFEGFEMIRLHQLDPDMFLSSQVPEIILLAILSNYPKEQAESILRLLYQQLQRVCKTRQELDRYIIQLRYLSKIRNLRLMTNQNLKDMLFNFDYKQDELYQKGQIEGMEKGMEKGEKKGEKKGREETLREEEQKKIPGIKTLLDKGFPIEEIAVIMVVSIELVKRIQQEVQDET